MTPVVRRTADRVAWGLALLFVTVWPAMVAGQHEGEIVTKQYADGGIYQGTFRNGLQHGQGTYRLPSGYAYSGGWVEGEMEGDGVAHFPDGSIYEGSFAAGRPHGRGRITFSDGGTYESDWRQGRRTGTGVAVHADGVRHEGEFRRGERHGQGRLVHPSGNVYEGQWQRAAPMASGACSTPAGPSTRASLPAGSGRGRVGCGCRRAALRGEMARRPHARPG